MLAKAAEADGRSLARLDRDGRRLTTGTYPGQALRSPAKRDHGNQHGGAFRCGEGRSRRSELHDRQGAVGGDCAPAPVASAVTGEVVLHDAHRPAPAALLHAVHDVVALEVDVLADLVSD